MRQKISIALLSLFLIVSNAFSVGHHMFTLAPSLEYDFPPNEPQLFSNFLPWSIKAECTIITEESQSIIAIKPVNDKGCSINGTELKENDVIEMTVSNGSKFIITANRRVTVELTNHGEKLMKARCSTTS